MDINQIKETIKNLDKDTVLKLVQVLADLSKQKAKPNKPKSKTKAKAKPTAKKRGRPPKKKDVDEDIGTEENITLGEDGGDDNEVDDEPAPVASKRRKPKPLNNKGGRNSKGSPGYIEKFKPIKNRPNLFLTSEFKDLHKEDTKIDKKLNRGRKPTERGGRNLLVEVECRECGNKYSVREDLIFFDEEGCRWVCDSCVGKGE